MTLSQQANYLYSLLFISSIGFTISVIGLYYGETLDIFIASIIGIIITLAMMLSMLLGLLYEAIIVLHKYRQHKEKMRQVVSVRPARPIVEITSIV
jgi:hypothetical protein